MQRFGALKGDYDVTVGLPASVREMLHQTVGKRACDPFLVAGHPVVVGDTERDGVAVGGEQPAAGQAAHPVVGLPQQRLRHLLRDDLAAEDAREGVTDDALQSALEALGTAHGCPSSWSVPGPMVAIRARPGGLSTDGG